MINMLFEDGSNSCVRDLMLLTYSDMNVKITFADGVGNFEHIVLNGDKDDLYIIYIDVVPDNQMTAKEYRRLRRVLRHNTNHVIVPIYGLDYLILKAYFPDIFIEPDKAVCAEYPKEGLYKNITSLEKYYKYLLDSTNECCSFGRYCNKSIFNEMYYKQDCLYNSRLNKSSKSLNLIRMLPIFPRYNLDGKGCIKADINSYVKEFTVMHNKCVELAFDSGKIDKQSKRTCILNI